MTQLDICKLDGRFWFSWSKQETAFGTAADPQLGHCIRVLGLLVDSVASSC